MAIQYPAGIFEEMAKTGEFGPMMRAITARQRAFVIAYFTAGDNNATNAAKAAGYSASSEVSLRVQGYSSLHSPRVQAAMHEYARSRLQARVPSYLRELDYLATDRKSTPPETRLKAALGGLNRAGLGGEININQNVAVTLSFDEKVLELRRLAALAGDDPDKALEGLAPLAKAGVVTDAEYEEIA